jgi:2,4-dienoyl-CoA reductase-like NADH-dependent reductase (Old Yellow Enzyme family)
MNPSPLAEPLTLPCGLVLPNRLCKASMTEALADDFGRPTPELCKAYKMWSAGGTGLLLTGNVQVDRRYIERPGNVCIDGTQSEEQLELLRGLAASGKVHNGSKIFVQLSHAGRQSNGMVNSHPIGPGDSKSSLPESYIGAPRAMTVAEIEDVIGRFVYAAKVCKATGFDGIQIHAAHGYLLSSFLNPLANNRIDIFGDKDMYGGVLKNRQRLLLTVVQRIREEVGPAYPISVKLNSADFQKGGFTTEEAVLVAQALEREKIDLLEISGGNYESGIYLDDSINSAAAQKKKATSTIKRESYFMKYALEIQKALSPGGVLPVMVTGGWRHRESMEKTVDSNACAMIGLGRPLCGDPNCSKRLLERSIENLPSYENDIVVGNWGFRWMFQFGIGKAIKALATQSWYYRNIYSMGIAGKNKTVEDLYPIQALRENWAHEKEKAKNLKGMIIECEGSVYKGLQTNKL